MSALPRNSISSVKRYSVDTDELVKRIHASKPKSVFLDAKPKMTNQRGAFGKKSKIDVTEQGLQSIKRAAFATETSNEVEKATAYNQFHTDIQMLSFKSDKKENI